MIDIKELLNKIDVDKLIEDYGKEEPECLDADGVPIKVGDTVYWMREGEPAPGHAPVAVEGIVDCERFISDERDGTRKGKMYTHRKPDSWEKLEEDAKMVKACDYAHAPRDEYGITVCRDCRFQKSKSCRQEMILDMIARAKKLSGIEEQDGSERTAIADKEDR